MKEVVRYSEAFKRTMVNKIERGEYTSLLEAGRKNGIRGNGTIERWVKQYGREDLLPKRVRVETMAEIDELKVAKQRIRELEQALSDVYMDWCLERAFLDIACEQSGTTAEALKKNNASRLAGARRSTGI